MRPIPSHDTYLLDRFSVAMTWACNVFLSRRLLSGGTSSLWFHGSLLRSTWIVVIVQSYSDPTTGTARSSPRNTYSSTHAALLYWIRISSQLRLREPSSWSLLSRPEIERDCRVSSFSDIEIITLVYVFFWRTIFNAKPTTVICCILR